MWCDLQLLLLLAIYSYVCRCAFMAVEGVAWCVAECGLNVAEQGSIIPKFHSIPFIFHSSRRKFLHHAPHRT